MDIYLVPHPTASHLSVSDIIVPTVAALSFVLCPSSYDILTRQPFVLKLCNAICHVAQFYICNLFEQIFVASRLYNMCEIVLNHLDKQTASQSETAKLCEINYHNQIPVSGSYDITAFVHRASKTCMVLVLHSSIKSVV